MDIFVSKSARKLLKSIGKEVKRRRKAGLDMSQQQDFANSLQWHKTLAPQLSPNAYWQIVKELCNAGLGTYYIRGGLKLNDKGIFLSQYPFLLNPVFIKLEQLIKILQTFLFIIIRM